MQLERLNSTISGPFLVISLNVVSVHSKDEILLIVFNSTLKQQIVASLEFVIGKPDEPEIVPVLDSDAVCVKAGSHRFDSLSVGR